MYLSNYQGSTDRQKFDVQELKKMATRSLLRHVRSQCIITLLNFVI